MAAVLWGVVLALGIDILRVGGVEVWLVARGLASGSNGGPPYEARGRLVDVAGRSVYLDCRGEGSPTVIFEAGLGGSADGWGVIFDRLTTITRTCVWDRPGLGRSTARGVHTGVETARDLDGGLAAAGERGPYVVVAHSFGGVYARLFAATSDDVAALVMLDTYDPDLGMEDDPTLHQAFRDQVRLALDETARSIEITEGLDWERTLVELREAGPPAASMVVLSTDPYRRYHDPAATRREAQVAAWRRAIVALYPRAEIEIVPNAGHFIHLDQPDLVFDRVEAIVMRIRAAG